MSVQLVNGYPCANCSEAAKARQGIDPRENPLDAIRPQGEPASANALADRAVEEPASPYDVRARLDYSTAIDRLI